MEELLMSGKLPQHNSLNSKKKAHGGMHVLQFTPLFFWKTYCERRQKDTFHIWRELKVWGLLNVNWIGVVYVWKFVCVAENLDNFPKVHTFTTQNSLT